MTHQRMGKEGGIVGSREAIPASVLDQPIPSL